MAKMIAYKQDVNQEYVNPFKNVYPFSKIGRVLREKDSKVVVQRLNESNSNLDETGNPSIFDEALHDFSVYFPKFYWKRTWKGEVLEEAFIEAPVPKHTKDIPQNILDMGFSVPGCFVNSDGTIEDYILYDAFKSVELNGQLRSVPGYKPTANKTISAFRDLARQGRNTKFGIEDYGVLTMVQFLFKVAFQDLNSQAVLGKGWTEKAESALTGSTMELGNRSGYLGTNGSQISLFGIEDFYGNIWSFVDGFLVTDEGYYTTYNNLNYGDLTKHELYKCTPLMGVNNGENVSDYVKNIEKTNTGYIPKALGGSSSKWYSDNF
ncbi:MAG: hypothetical protein ACRC0G_09240, partial [Fusobacteriaceae bacterium]